MPGPARPPDHNERDEDNTAQRDSGRNAGIEPRDDTETVVGRCVCVID